MNSIYSLWIAVFIVICLSVLFSRRILSVQNYSSPTTYNQHLNPDVTYRKDHEKALAIRISFIMRFKRKIKRFKTRKQEDQK